MTLRFKFYEFMAVGLRAISTPVMLIYMQACIITLVGEQRLWWKQKLNDFIVSLDRVSKIQYHVF